jgi:hypothetical protein
MMRPAASSILRFHVSLLTKATSTILHAIRASIRTHTDVRGRDAETRRITST